MKRKIVQIDQEKCNGCGLCAPACAEGAIRIVNGKAVLSADNLCDGLGACLGECPQDAISIIEREADEFSEAAVAEHLGQAPVSAQGEQPREPAHDHRVAHHGGCPGARVISLAPPAQSPTAREEQPSMLRQWPVQLHLVPVNAPYFRDADLLITADCVPFAYADFHRDFLAGKVVVVGCPKLDDNSFYQEKLTELFRVATIKSITVMRMEVPCCGGIVMAARQALVASGKDIPLHEVTITIGGEVQGADAGMRPTRSHGGSL
ncbi:MAG TPA: 4Fe-4S binding protein [Geobacteraceae bacterium]|nr:4Fe-4S binding protein [Geobacteraceae bacterium]